MANDLQAGEVGVAITIYVNPQPPQSPADNPIDVRTAVSVALKIRQPVADGGAISTVSGTTGSSDGTANGSYVQYVTTSSDFTTPGLYTLQAILNFPGGVIRKTPEFTLQVGSSL